MDYWLGVQKEVTQQIHGLHTGNDMLQPGLEYASAVQLRLLSRKKEILHFTDVAKILIAYDCVFATSNLFQSAIE